MKRRSKTVSIVLVVYLIGIFSCDKKEKTFNREFEPDVIKRYNNELFEKVKLDSLETMFLVVNQKIQEVLDLSALSWHSKEGSIDSILNQQLYTYFAPSDSMLVNQILSEFDSLKVYHSEIHTIDRIQDTLDLDSIKKAKVKLNYYSKDKRFLQNKEKTISYIIQAIEEKEDSASFQFYFTAWEEENDSILLGETQ